MAREEHQDAELARSAAHDLIPVLLSSSNEAVLSALLENPLLDETQVCLLLDRKDLSGALVGEIAGSKAWSASYRIRLALAAHPHAPRLQAMRFLRDLHLMDLARVASLPSSPAEIRRGAELRVLAQLPQLPMGHRLTLARHGSARIAGALLALGPEKVSRLALENPFLSEAEVLRTLASAAIAEQAVSAIAGHSKWSQVRNVRVALIRSPHTPVDRLRAFVRHLSVEDLETVLDIPTLPEKAKDYLRQERKRRSGAE